MCLLQWKYLTSLPSLEIEFYRAQKKKQQQQQQQQILSCTTMSIKVDVTVLVTAWIRS